MPFRATFDCLWCGTAHACRGPDDLEGWAQLCPDCVGKAGDNGFLRFRLRQALTERATGATAGGVAVPAVDPSPAPAGSALQDDDWYLRRGRHAHGPIHDAAWNAELDAAGRWLDGLPWHGEIVELAAGTGWWSPLLASRGELSLYDGVAAPLERARDRLVAHGLRAHLHVRDAWAEPDRAVDALFTGFWLGQVLPERLEAFLDLVRRWLKPGGTFAFIDSLSDPQSSAADYPDRESTIVKVYYEPVVLEVALRRAGFENIEVATTGRFFLTGVGQARM